MDIFETMPPPDELAKAYQKAFYPNFSRNYTFGLVSLQSLLVKVVKDYARRFDLKFYNSSVPPPPTVYLNPGWIKGFTYMAKVNEDTEKDLQDYFLKEFVVAKFNDSYIRMSRHIIQDVSFLDPVYIYGYYIWRGDISWFMLGYTNIGPVFKYQMPLSGIAKMMGYSLKHERCVNLFYNAHNFYPGRWLSDNQHLERVLIIAILHSMDFDLNSSDVDAYSDMFEDEAKKLVRINQGMGKDILEKVSERVLRIG